jgi:hypothetical protein
MNKMKPQKEVKVEGWEKRFDECWDNWIYHNHKVKDFIRSLLKAHTSRIVGIVEGKRAEIKDKDGLLTCSFHNDWMGNCNCFDDHNGRNAVIDDILKAIKEIK